MKLLSPLLFFWTLFSFSISVYAQYYSAGWQPGQKVVREGAEAREWGPGDHPEGSPPPPVDTGMAPPSETSFHWSKFLTEGPIGNALLKVGLNYSAVREEAERRKANMWDKRIPLITDDNYESLVVNETFSNEEEERERVWFLIITIQADQPRGLSQMFDEKFDEAYDISAKENDLPHVKWGRIDYVNVTALTTKWGVWQAPKLVVLADRGKTLWFLSPNQVRLDVDAMRGWLKDKGYTEHQPWSSSFAPGGSNEWVLHYFAQLLSLIYGQTTRIPRTVLILVTGAIGTFLVQFLHRGSSKKQDPRPKKALPQQLRRPQPASTPIQPVPVPAPAPGPAPAPVTNNAATTSSTNTPSPSKAKKRRGKN